MFLAKRLFFHHDEQSGKSLVLNSVSGAIDFLPVDLARKLEAHRGKRLPDVLMEAIGREVDTFRQRGYVFETGEAENVTLHDLRQKIETAVPPLTKFVLCPTYACNLACTYCYEGPLTRRRGVMSVEHLGLALKAINSLKRRPEIQRYLYELFGGEPLLPATRAVVATLLTFLEQRGETVAIVTNGTHVEEFLPLLQQHQSAVESLQITLDGPKTVHDRRRFYSNGTGSFEPIVHGVDRLLEAGFFVRLRTNVDRQNIGEIGELLAFMERREWTTYRHFICELAPVTYHTQFVSYESVMREEEIVDTILEDSPDLLGAKSPCHLGMFRILNHITSALEAQRAGVRVLPTFTYCEATEGSVYVFGPDGAIYPCPDAVIDRKWAVGEYAPLFWLDEEQMKMWRRDIFSIPSCRDCEIATLCGGGCALVPLEKGASTPDCNGASETLHAYLNAWFRQRNDKLRTIH